MRPICSACLPLVLLAACDVPEKHPTTTDGGGSDNTGEIETTITEAPAEFSNAALAMFRFKSNYTEAKFECAVDGAIAEPCTSPYTKNLGDGPHAFAVRATDGNGNEDSTPAEHLWSIDTVAPTTTLTMMPPAADNSTMVTFEFTSNEMNVIFECSLDNGGFAMCRSGDAFGPIGDGAHSFAVRARDRAGNVDASPAIHAWVVDTSTPDTSLLSGPANASPTSDATFTFISPDAGPGATFECALDTGGFAGCSSPVTYNGLAEGMHTFQVRVRDANGNSDPTPATDTWSVDLTAPDTSIASGPSGAVALASASFEFSSNELGVAFICSLDGGAMAPCTSPFSVGGLAQGAHSFAVAAIDAAGHTDASPATASWTVDTIPPDIAIVDGPGDATTSGPRVIFMFTMSEGTSQCSLDGGGFVPCASPVGYNLPAGSHTFNVRTVDGAGNTSTLTRSWVVACAPPDPSGALGLLHFDDGNQVQASATGGASATLGSTDMTEANDPTPVSGRFNGALGFVPAEGDLIAWPIAGASMTDITIELWARPDGLSGTRDILVNSDSRIAIRVMQDAGGVRFIATMVEGNGVMHTLVSAPVAAGTWHWVLVTLQEPTLRLWVDGAVTSASDVRLGSRPALDAVRLGGNFGGALDEVYISQSSTTTDEGALQRYCPL